MSTPYLIPGSEYLLWINPFLLFLTLLERELVSHLAVLILHRQHASLA